MTIDYDKLKEKLGQLTSEVEKLDADRGFCMVEQSPIDAKICINAAAIVADEASEFIVAVADILLKTNDFPDLRSDGEIVAKVERWIDLLNVAVRMDSLYDDEVYWKYGHVDNDCLLLAPALRCLIRDKEENIKRGFTPLKVANYLTESLSKVIKSTSRFERFDYDYSAIIADNKEYSRLAKGER